MTITDDAFRIDKSVNTKIIQGNYLQRGETPLHIAVRHCHLDVVRELLQFVSNQKSKVDAYMLVNGANWVSVPRKRL